MIEFVKVSKKYPHVNALHEVSFEIEEGEFTFLVGPSGSGKTSIIKMIIKEEEPTGGTIFYYDTDITKINGPRVNRLRREVSVVFQDFKLLPNKNLYENIAFVLEVSGKGEKDVDQTVKYVLDLVGLGDRARSFPNHLSGGEKQKIALARAIANNPKLLIADEPTGNLDPASSWEIMKILSKINEWGTTVIMATHGSSIVDKMGKRVIELDRGRIVNDNKKGIYPKLAVRIPVFEKTTPDITQSGISPKELPEEIVDTKEEPASLDTIKDETAVPAAEELYSVPAVEAPVEIETPQNIPENQSETITPDEQQSIDSIEIPPVEKEKPKEISLSFTTKSHSIFAHRRRAPGKDTVDITKLELPRQIEDALIMAGINSITELKELDSNKLKRIARLSQTEYALIHDALENQI